MPSEIALPRFEPKSFLYALRQNVRVISALVARESVTRYGNRSLGYLWALIEPGLWLTFFALIRSYVRTNIPFGESALLFFLTGAIAFRVFVAFAGKMKGAINANQALLTYPQVRPLDTIFARGILEFLTMFIVVGLLYALLPYIVETSVIYDPIGLLEALMATAYLGFSVGAFNAVMVALVPSWSSIWSLLSLPLFLLSGIIYVTALLPPNVQAILYWNPVLHCVEWVRSASYMSFVTGMDPSYPLMVATLFLVAALVLERIFRARMLRS